MKQIAVYYRVSTEKQDLKSQESAFDKWLEDLPQDEKPRKVHVYKDEGFSGKNFKRPQFQMMLADAFARKFDTIVVYKLDRFSRNASDAIKTILNLDEHGVAFISVTQPILSLGHSNPFRRTMLSAFAEIAEIERETIVSRVKSGLDAARRRGVRLGPPLKITEDTIEQAMSYRSQGLSFKKIADKMELSVGTIHKIVKSQPTNHE